VWRRAGETRQVVAAKGAPEAIAELCRLDPSARAALLAAVGRMADDGLRVLGVARAEAEVGDLPDDQRAFRFALLGLVGLADPLRATVPEAIRECRAAGIRVVMITGDYPATARGARGDRRAPRGGSGGGDTPGTAPAPRAGDGPGPGGGGDGRGGGGQ